MSRRSFLMALGLAVLLLGTAALALFLAVGYVPDVYSRAKAPQGEARRQESEKFLDEFSRLYNNAAGADRDWYVQFSDEQINSYLEEGFIKQGLAPRVMPDGVSRPHIVFEPGKAHVAFRYGGAWNTIITIDLRVWLAKQEPNAVALELEGLHAGALPISGQWLQEDLAKAGRESGGGMDVSWYRLNGHPVALLRFQGTRRIRRCYCRTCMSIRVRSPFAAARPRPPCTLF